MNCGMQRTRFDLNRGGPVVSSSRGVVVYQPCATVTCFSSNYHPNVVQLSLTYTITTTTTPHLHRHHTSHHTYITSPLTCSHLVSNTTLDKSTPTQTNTMHFLTLLLATASATLSFAAPTPQAAPTSGEDAPEVPPFQVLTCQAGSIEVRSEWNTAFLVSIPIPRSNCRC